jgi:hypothetical protein
MHVFGIAGVCIHWEEPLLVAELLDADRATTLLRYHSALS